MSTPPQAGGEEAETPPIPPVNGGGKEAETPSIPLKRSLEGNRKKSALSTARRKEDVTLRRVVGEVLLGNTETAEAILRTYNECKGQLAKHQHGQQIARIEEYFRKVTGHDPWFEGIPPVLLMHFRGKIGMILNTVKLARLLDDIKQNSTVKNIIYFLSTDLGKKASRWEMLMVEAREEEYARNKVLERAEMCEAYDRIFGKTPLNPPVNGGKVVEPSWVFGLKAERDNLIAINKVTGSAGANYRDNVDRIKEIDRRLQRWEQTGR